MFYSQFILAKKGPLGTIWIAAHLERKLRKNQVADTDIGDSVDSILSPDVPIALRLSSHLLLGVVRIYNKKVNYLFDDCSEALLKIKQAFRSTAVDLPPEESKAPYHSITLPETFDLDDFELPDSDIFQGNYVDHHVSSKEQITLQDTMEGVSYSTSKFGLDERFGDGDASGLDLDEELFLDKIGTEGHADESVDVHASFGPTYPLKQDEQPENTTPSSEGTVDGVDEDVDLVDYAQAPGTPGLVEQPNLSNVRDSSACEDHLEAEDHLMSSEVRESTNDVPCDDKQEGQSCSLDERVSDTVHQGLLQETGHILGGLEVEESKPKEESPTVDETGYNHQDPKEIVLEKSALEDSGLGSTGKQTSEGIEFPDNPGETKNQEKRCHDDSVLGLDDQVGSFLKISETQAGDETNTAPNLDAHDKEATSEDVVLMPCNSVPEHPSVTKPGLMPTEKESNTSIATYEGKDTSNQGEASCATGNSEQKLKENQVEECASGEDIQMSATEANDQVHIISQSNLVDTLNDSAKSEVPAPEKLLSVPDGRMDLHGGLGAEISPINFEEIGDGAAGSKSAAGRKRSFTESTLTEQSLYSVESSRQVRVKGTVESVPDDDDLLSSILVGRRSSVLKVRPTPLSEVTSVKHSRTASRSAPKRKVLMDEMMVLHGDTIRKQLTNTEDIRRVRKKAPCTLPEISMILNKQMEDDIFLKSFFSGTSTDLVSLHSQVYDLSHIRVSQNNAVDASLEIMTKLDLPFQDDKNCVSLEASTELNLSSCNEKHIASLDAVGECHLTSSPNIENHDIESNKGLGKTNVMEESEQGVNNASLIVAEHDRAEPCVNSQLSENMLEEGDPTRVEININQQSNPIKLVGADGLQQELSLNQTGEGILQQELSLNQTGEGISQLNDDSANPALNAEMQPLDFTCVTGNMGDKSAIPDQHTLVHTFESECAGVDDGPSIVRTESPEKDNDATAVAGTEFGARNDIFPVEGAAGAVVHGVNYGELEYSIQSGKYNVPYEEQREVEFSYLAGPSVLDDGILDNGEKTDNQEDNLQNMADAEMSGFDMHDRDELNYTAAGNDTEFLNVDDDDLAEMADDYLPDDEEKEYTENSGWSSRTRAVSKYLQASFIKEADSGRTSLSLNNLLVGKSRKEASRMFFETLVLKTRDYIHVEQTNPFDDITIKPRMRLMKSDF